MSGLTKQNVLAFMNRDWATARSVKDAGTARWVREHGTTAAFALAQALFDQVWERVRVEQQGEAPVGLIELRRKLRRAAKHSS